MKILIAEDDAVSRKVLARFLEKWGHEVVAAADGAEALRLFESDGAFSAVISDWMMPELDGPELVRRIRARPARGYVYVMLLTAKSGKESLVEGLEAGADDFLTKPFDHEELRVRLRTAERIVKLEADLAAQFRRLESLNTDLMAANGKMKRDLEAAAAVQKALLPAPPPEFPGIRFSWVYRPCDELAGDMLNILRLDDRHVGLYVLDVSGHGVAAALLSVVVVRALSRLSDPESPFRRRLAALHSGDAHAPVSPPEVLREMFRNFPADPATGQYFTLGFGVLDLQTRRLRTASAGHPQPAYVPAAGPPRLLEIGGFPIGLLEGFDPPNYAESVIDLAAGDRFVMYSDGLVEAMNDRREVFGDRRLLEALTETRTGNLETDLAALVERTQSWSGTPNPADDVSVVAFEVT